MGVGADVRIDSQADRSLFPGFGGQLVDDLKLGGGFHVEPRDSVFKGEPYFGVALPHPGIDYALRAESRVERGPYLSSAHAVGPEAAGGYLFQQHGIGVRLYRIMHLEFRICGRT